MYFFTEIQKLSNQLIGDSYGPVNTDLTNKYNVTSKFSLENNQIDAKVFACVNANMIVQQSDVNDSLVNIILKPSSALKVPIDVEFYVYRGVLKNSLIDEQNNSIAQLSTESNDLIKRMWKDSPSDLSYTTLGYNNEIEGNTGITDIFNSLFENINSIYVTEGEWIGTFSNSHKIGFEVILKTSKFKVDVSYVREGEYVVDVTNLSDYNERIKREEILGFLDPAALYGRHLHEKVRFYDTAQNKTLETTATSGSNFIYTILIEKFHTKNRLYIDIRSEKGYSYNFYKNYKISETDLKNIQIRHESGAGNLTSQEYQTNNWPILFVESQHTSGIENTLRLKLRIDDNTKPILYLAGEANGKIKDLDKESDYIKTDTLIKTGNNYLTGWTKEFSLKIPNTQLGTSRKYICNYIKMNYFRTLYNEILPDTVLKNQYYYDSAFCSVDLPDIGNQNSNFKHIESSEPVYIRELNNDNGTGNFQLNMENGAYWNSNRILFYSRIQYENTKFISEKVFLNTYSQKLDLNTREYNDSELKRRTDIICREYEIEAGNIIRIPSINFYTSNDLRGDNSSQKNHKENLMLLGLTIDELNSIKNDTQLDNRHQRFIHLEPVSGNPHNTIQDTNNNNATYRYYKYTLQLQGLDSNGNRVIVVPQHNGALIIVYSRDNEFFSSAAFSANEPLTIGQNGQNQTNRIEFHIYYDGIIKINDNIDFALIHNTQNIWFLYHGENNIITEITNLDIILISKMGSGYPVNSIPNGYTETIDYTPYNNDGVDAKTSYIYNEYVITEGSKTVNHIFYSYYKIRYNKINKRAFMVKVLDLNIESLNMNFEFTQTRRFYCSPEVAAVFFGSLVDIGNYTDNAPTIDFVIKSTGSSYEDGTAFPSVSHNNGYAIDTLYQNTVSGLTKDQQLARDQAFVNAMHKFGSTQILRGQSGHYSAALANATNGGSLHNNHLHCGVIVLKDGVKTL